jgi:catechol 2,3-dioxygenase-like lactoylglutathione lyase family enzyme
MKLTSTVLGARDPRALAVFYATLLGWAIKTDEPEWVTLRPDSDGPDSDGPGLSFQLEPDHVPPEWPQADGAQQMQLHLDIEVDDLDAAGEVAIAAGAGLAAFQPQEKVRVYLDPAGHPFCLWTRE